MVKLLKLVFFLNHKIQFLTFSERILYLAAMDWCFEMPFESAVSLLYSRWENP